MRRAILVRHAESEASAAGLIGLDPPLTEAGREQARALTDRLPPVELVVTSGLRRAAETADLAAPEAPRIVFAELNEIGFGNYEGGEYLPYREWAGTAGAADPSPGGGESRLDAVRRYVQGLRALLARPEATILVVVHGLVVRYVLNALDGLDPAPLLDDVPCAQPYQVDATDLRRAVERLEAWTREPRW